MNKPTPLRIPGEILHTQTQVDAHRWSVNDSVIEHLLNGHQGDDARGVFVSYAHEDGQQVLPWVANLIEHGLSVHYDEGGVRGGGWFEELARSIDRCAGMVFVVSPRSIASLNCHRELQHALAAGKPVAFTTLGAWNRDQGERQ